MHVRAASHYNWILLYSTLAWTTCDAFIIKRWPLNETIPTSLDVDGSAAGPNATAMCIAWDTGSCHNPGSECNQCRSNDPHIFNMTWCADTTGFVGISCDLDLGYRSAQGARYGAFLYSVAGLGSRDSDFSNISTVRSDQSLHTNICSSLVPQSDCPPTLLALPIPQLSGYLPRFTVPFLTLCDRFRQK